MIRIGAATLLVIRLASSARAQGATAYLTLARQYAAGQGRDAETPPNAWPQGDVTAAATVAAATASVHDLMAAVMRSRARAPALAGLQIQKNDAPWRDHRIGFDRESLTWLRAEARRP